MSLEFVGFWCPWQIGGDGGAKEPAAQPCRRESTEACGFLARLYDPIPMPIVVSVVHGPSPGSSDAGACAGYGVLHVDGWFRIC